MYLIYTDVETSGLYPTKHSILQIASIVVKDGEEVNTFQSFMKPCKGDEVDIQALKCNGITHEMLEGFPDSYTAFQAYKKFLEHYVNPFDKKDKAFFVGYNAKFDEEFVRSWFKKNGSNYYGSYFWVPCLDVMQYAGLALIEKRQQLPDFKLGTVADALRLKPEGDLHDALVDIRLTREVMKKAVEMLTVSGAGDHVVPNTLLGLL